MASETTPIFGSCELGLADFEHAVKHEPRTTRLLRYALPIGVVSLGLAVVAWMMRSLPVAAGLVLLGLFAIGALGLPEQVARRWFEKTAPANRAFKFTASNTGLIVSSAQSTHHYPWQGLHGFYEAPNCFLIWVSESLFLIVPKRAFASQEVAQVARLMLQRVPPREPLHALSAHFVVGTCLAVAVVVAIFVALRP